LVLSGGFPARFRQTTMPPEAARRRTFAIISHPDAGKTTLTEKFLLYGGAVELAGSVTARKNQRSTTSDWMELERKRGISVSSTVLAFDYAGYRINLLDTPGHKDFSEDTYRVLTAVDAVVMVIDAGKGVETQTRKLFEVCSRRGIPIFTFMNKLDRPSMDLLGLMDEVESVLGIKACAMNWPLGTGPDFRGVFDRRRNEVHVFERTRLGAHRAPERVGGIDDPFVREHIDPASHRAAIEQLEMLEIAGASFDRDEVLAGRLTPVFFGSAMNNFGVQLLLDTFLELAPGPTSRRSGEREVAPSDAPFSGFIFKIQANMDPKHRDRIAFVRVVSGKFDREMLVHHSRTGRKVRLGNSQKVFGRERETLDEAWPGDVVGFVGQSDFGIGDTLTEDASICYREIPRFTPECFAFIHNPTPSNFKRFRTGLEQLLQEGVVQAFELPYSGRATPLLAAVGPLQFDVVQYRLESEYNAPARVEQTPWRLARWVRFTAEARDVQTLDLPSGAAHAVDQDGNQVVLFTEDWAVNFFNDRNEGVELLAEPPGVREA
jgi:peptide chain release factor 3